MSEGPVFDLYSIYCILIIIGVGWFVLSSGDSNHGSEHKIDLSERESSQENIFYDNRELQKVMESAALASEGENKLESGEYELALQYFDDSLQIYMNTNAAYGKGEALISLGRYDEAIAIYDLVIQRLPYVESQKAWSKKAYLLYATGRYEEAVAVYNQITHIDQLDPISDEYLKLALSKLNT